MRSAALLTLGLTLCLSAHLSADTDGRRAPRDQSRERWKRAVTNYQWALQFRRLQQPGNSIERAVQQGAQYREFLQQQQPFQIRPDGFYVQSSPGVWYGRSWPVGVTPSASHFSVSPRYWPRPRR